MAAPKGNKFAEGRGRPTKYNSSLDEKVYKFALLGLTDDEMAYFLDIETSTFNEWKKTYPSFSESIQNGKINDDSEVANALYNRAKGYEVQDVKIFQFQGSEVIVPYTKIIEPDVQAASLWLRNRQPKRWRDKLDLTGGQDEAGNDKPVQIVLNLGKEI